MLYEVITGTLISWIMPDGDTRWLAVEAFGIDGEPGSSAHFYTDVTEKLRLRQERDALASELQSQSLYDASLVVITSYSIHYTKLYERASSRGD